MNKLFLYALLLFVFGCNKQQKSENQSLSTFSSYIESFSEGTVSVSDPVIIHFTSGVDATVDPKKVFSIQPNVAGSIDWKDDRTLLFVPDAYLTENTTYEVSVSLKDLFPKVPKAQHNFSFNLKTLIQNFEFSTDEIRFYDSNDLSRANLTGYIQTADVISLEKVKKMVAAAQNGNALDIKWEAPKGKTSFSFSIENIETSQEVGFVDLEIDGYAIGVNKTERKKIEVPATEAFKVLSSKVVRGAENYVSITFSNPLDSKQNLKGFVKVQKKRVKAVIDGNELKVYLRENQKGLLDIHLFKGIKNTAGKRLGKDYETRVHILQTKPEVRFATKDNKAILPTQNKQVIAFEAIGLNAVEVNVVKVFDDNILQYLQVNPLGGEQQLNRVARPIVSKTIDLSALGVTNFEKWNNFSINLSDLIRVDPGALYQINIGFRRKHSVYQCETDEENLIEELPEEEDWNSYNPETSYWDSYQGYYSQNFNWEQRDNPCDDSYYGKRRSIKKLFLASDFGIVAKRSDFGALSVFVTNLLTTKPLENVEVSVYDFQQQLLGTAKTNFEGKAEIEIPGMKPFALIAKKEGQAGYLKLDDFSSLSLSNFDISGTTLKKGIKGFIYGERGVWRPSDTIHLSFILRDNKRVLPEGYPVVMELYDPNNRLTYRKINEQPVGNIFRYDFVTDEEALTGNWNAKVRVGPSSFEKRIRVETVKPNRLKIDLKPLKSKLDHRDTFFEGKLNVSWLTGAKAGNLTAQYEMMLKPVKTSFKGFANYTFDDSSRSFSSGRTLAYQGKLDAAGNASVKIGLGENLNAPGALNLILFGKVFEEGGDFSVSKTQIPFYPFKSFVGFKMPDGDKRGMLLTDKKHSIQIATVDANATLLSKKKVKVSLYKLNWRWWWDRSYESISNYIGRSSVRPEYTFFATTSNGKGTCEIEVEHQEWGRYFVKVEDLESGHSAGQIAYFDWPGWAGKAKDGQLDGASMLDFSVEKEAYDVGEEISISLPTTAGNRILVSLETGKDILNTFWVASEEKRTQIKFEATKEMTPNVYVHLTMIQPYEQDKNDLPIRLYGIKNIKVVDKETRLNPSISLPSVLRPEQTFNVNVSEENGTPMNYTLAVVEEGLLDLTSFKTPDPWESFFSKEALSVKTWDLYDNVMSAFASKNTFMTSIGGDGELDAKDEKNANRFKPVVKYLGPFSLGKGETKSHTITMPQYLGSVRTMVVAASENAYGSADQTTAVKQDLMVLATMPRVAGPGEDMKLPVNVFSLSDDIKDVSVSIKTSGSLKVVGKTTKKIRFNEKGDQMVYFDVVADQSLGTGKVEVVASAGKLTSTYDVELNVIPRNPPIAVVASAQTVTGKTPWNYEYKPIGIKGTNEAIIELSTLPPLNLESRLGYLIRYPHGCVEQITSSVFPQLYLDDLVELSRKQKKEIQENINEAIFRLGRFQTSEGGFAYWPGGQISSQWGSNYAGHFLLEAKNLGYAVPETLLNKWLGYQTTAANNWAISTESSGLIQAYRLYVLALAKKPAISAMNRMKEEDRIGREARWRLALAYTTAGFGLEAKEMIKSLENATITSSTENHYRNTFGSRLRDQAMQLETLTALSDNEKAYDLLIGLATKMGSVQWMSTQTTAYSLLAIGKYVKANSLEDEVDATVSINGERIKLKGGNKYLHQIALEDPEKTASLKVSKSGNTAIYVRFINKGIPLIETRKDEKSNINFSVDYYDSSDNLLDVSSLTKGTNFYAQVSVSNPGSKGKYTELALTQIFPSGWEIINTRLDDSEENDAAVTYKDIRDDRVMHYFDLKPNQKATFTVLLNASYEGKYYLPMTHVGAMYDNSIYGIKSGKWVQVVSESD